MAVILHCVIAGEWQADPDQALEVLLDLLPDWIQLVIGLNDLLDAYRQCPNAPWQAYLNIVGFCIASKAWMCMSLKRHVSGNDNIGVLRR